jgi:hypothetical protein
MFPHQNLNEHGKQEDGWSTMLPKLHNTLLRPSHFTQYPMQSFLLFIKVRSLGHSYMMYLLIIFEVLLSIKNASYLLISELLVYIP